MNCEEDANLFSYQSNLVSYEELVAEALVDAQLMSRLRDLSRALSAIQRPDGKDGISVLTNTIFDLVVPSRSCLNLDCKASPLRYRDGRASTTTNTGHPVEAVSPLYLLLDSLNAIDARLETSSQEKRLPAWRRARSRLVDVFFDVERDGPEAWRFKSPRGRAILDESLGFLRRRLAQYRQEEAACDAANPAYGTCHQVHDWAFGLAPRLARSLGQPVSAAALRLMDRLRDVDSDPAGKVFDLVAHLTGERANDETFAQILLGVTDLLQALKDTENLGPLMVFGSRALSPNANAVTRGAARDLEIQNGTVEKAITLVRSLQGIAPEEGDRKSTIASLLARLASPHRADGATPLDVIVDAVVGVNRAAPSAQGGGPLSSEDLRALLHETEAFMSSERHGLERLYDIVQSRELP